MMGRPAGLRTSFGKENVPQTRNSVAGQASLPGLVGLASIGGLAGDEMKRKGAALSAR